MRVNHYIVEGFLLLALSFVGSNNALSVAAVAPGVGGKESPTQWKSIPEDSAPWKREPFKSPESSQQSTGPSDKSGFTGAQQELVLQGIMKGNNRYYAIINGRTVKPGDRIDGWNVSEISRYRVTLHREKEQQIYDIYQGKIDRGTR